MKHLGILCAGLLLLLAGCLPYSCRPRESNELMPSDSLSRDIAAAVEMDTLQLEWEWSGSLSYPRTIRFGSNAASSIYVSDVERGSIFILDAEGNLLDELESFEVPYIAGIDGDTLAVFNPEELSIKLVTRSGAANTITINDSLRTETSLVYAAYNGRLYYKRVGPDAPGVVARLTREGRIQERYALSGPHWRHAGLLREWGDTLLSLSGFRPVVDVIRPGIGVDSLALRGFDSPMLSRSRAFLLGDVHEAPLLSASAVGSEMYLFVLNLRAGWLHLDVFDREGVLQHRLTQQDRQYESSFFPQDLDVRRRADGSYAIAVAVSQPQPEVRLYTWDGARW